MSHLEKPLGREGVEDPKTTPDFNRFRPARSGTHAREDVPPDDGSERRTEPPPPPPEDPLVGEVLGGRYRIARKEREDDETVTFVASHTRLAGYEVLVHLLAPALRDSKAERLCFRGTWELYTYFESVRDHVLRVEDLWDDDLHGAPVAVTEAPSGFRLDEWTAQSASPPPLDRALEWGRELAVVLDAMHGHGVTHGDLRPEILYLANVGAHQIVKLASFGTRRNSRQVSRLGFGAYRAPEHQEGGVTLGFETDVWSYGLVVYELLTRRRFARDEADLAKLARGDFEPRTAERAPHLRGVAPETLDAWLSQCLRRDPAARFPGVTVAFQALHAALHATRSKPSPRSRPPAAPSPSPSPLPPSTDGDHANSEHSPTVSIPALVITAEPRVVCGDRRTIWGLCATRDGRAVFTAGDDGVVREWEPSTCLLVREIRDGHVGRIRCVAVTPDGARLVSGGSDRAVVIHDLRDAEREPVRSAQHQSVVTSVTVAPDGSWMLTTSEDGTAIAWDLTRDRVLWATPRSPRGLQAAVIARDGDTFITGGHDGAVLRWSLRERRCLGAFDGHRGDVRALALSPDERTLVSCGHEGRIYLWEGPASPRELYGPKNMVTCVAWGDGWFVTGSSDPDVRLWDPATGRCLQTLTEGEWVVRAVAVDPLGRYLYTASSSGHLRIRPLGA